MRKRNKKMVSKCITRKIEENELVEVLEKTILALNKHKSMTPTSFYIQETVDASDDSIDYYTKELSKVKKCIE